MHVDPAVCSRAAEAILAVLERLPALTLEIDRDQRSAGVRARSRLVAYFPSSRQAANGGRFDLADPQDSSEALAAIRRRVTVETLFWQYRAASS
jgi:hypothetical protein